MPRRFVTLLLLALASVAPASLPAEAPDYPDHNDLSYFLDQQGNRVPVKCPADWEQRRAHILANMQKVMGELPGPDRRVDLQVEILEEIKVGDLIRRKITYQAEPGDRVPAYLFLPPQGSNEKRPAVVCLHQTTNLGKGEPAGMGHNVNLHYALELAQRGYVTIAPDYPRFGDNSYKFEEVGKYDSNTMKGIWNHIRAVDLLQSLPQVDKEQIGCIGHSLGGHNTIFLAVFDTRIKAAVSSCGFNSFPKYYAGNLKGWASLSYMPRIEKTYANDPRKMPFDFPELIAAIAPRPFFTNSPLHDANFEVSGVRDSIQAAQPVYRLLEKPDNLQARYPNAQHDFPVETRMEAYDFLDRHLGHTRKDR